MCFKIYFSCWYYCNTIKKPKDFLNLTCILSFSLLLQANGIKIGPQHAATNATHAGSQEDSRPAEAAVESVCTVLLPKRGLLTYPFTLLLLS